MIKLQQLREEQRLSKRKLAFKAGVDPAVISYAENRGFQLYDGQLAKLAPVLGVGNEEMHSLLDTVQENEHATN